MGKGSVQAKQWLDKYYSDSVPSETTVKMWYTDFKRAHTDTNNVERSGHPNSIVVPENKKLHKLVLAIAQSAGAIEYTDCISAEG